MSGISPVNLLSPCAVRKAMAAASTGAAVTSGSARAIGVDLASK